VISKDFNPGPSHPYYFMRRGLLSAMKKWAPELKGKLLDFGCGSKPYRSLFNVEEYIGLDYEKTGHDHTNEQIDVFYDGRSIPFPDEHFDSILCSEVVEHLFNVPEVLKEMKRVLKPGGVILITCPFVWSEHEAPYDYARYTRFALNDIIGREGLAIKAFEKQGNFVQAVAQMRVLYFVEWAGNGLYRLSFAGRGLLKATVFMINICGRLKSRLFPNRTELYLSNIILVTKPGTGSID
jgi:SAM-dependent methyltransferase